MADKNFTHTYTADDIHIMKGLEGVRKRPAMYIGSTNAMGLHHLVWEVVDNAVDEALSGFGTKIVVTIHKDGSLSVLDEGRGIPVGINKETGKPAVEVVFTELHAGGKFNGAVYKTAGGLHGVGASVTNALSEWLDATVYQNGGIYHLRFENGGHLVTPLEQIGTTKKHGTLVRFKPDPTIFSTVEFKWETICNRLQESAFLMKGVHFVIIEEKTNQIQEFCYENGLNEYVSNINANKNKLTNVIDFSDVDDQTGISTEIALQWCNEDYNETLYSYVNNVRTRDGGTHETGFRTGITKAINDFAERYNIAKGKKLEGSDIREGLTAIISLKVPEEVLEFEGQTKGKLGTPQAVTIVSNFIYNKITYYLTENKEVAMNVINKCVASANARIAARKAKDEARNSKKQKQNVILSDKLTPAQSKDWTKNEIFIVEGDSAGGSAKLARDKKYQAILPLRGKVLNVEKANISDLLKNEEICTLISCLGTGITPEFDITGLKYNKVVIMTDADVDGAHIQILLLTFFYRYMKPLIEQGHIYIALSPLYKISSKDNANVKYAWSEEELDEYRKQFKSYDIQRYKGLGEMNAEQLWETTMDPNVRKFIKVNIDDHAIAEKQVSTLMGDNVSSRKKWINENVDFTLLEE